LEWYRNRTCLQRNSMGRGHPCIVMGYYCLGKGESKKVKLAL
jgi:hypothetical protein